MVASFTSFRDIDKFRLIWGAVVASFMSFRDVDKFRLIWGSMAVSLTSLPWTGVLTRMAARGLLTSPPRPFPPPPSPPHATQGYVGRVKRDGYEEMFRPNADMRVLAYIRKEDRKVRWRKVVGCGRLHVARKKKEARS